MTSTPSFFSRLKQHRAYKIFNLFFGLVLAVTIFFLIYPDPFFPHVLTYKQYTVRSRQPINPALKPILDKATQRLSRADINQPLHHDIYLIESFSAARFWGFQSIGALGWNAVGTDNIFIVKTDLPKDLCYRDAAFYNHRGLSEVLSHEMTHTLQKENIGLISFKAMPLWKTEGYAEYVCIDVDLSTAKEQLAAIKQNTDYGADYIRYRIAVSYLMRQKKFTWQQLIDTTLSLEDVLAEIEKK